MADETRNIAFNIVANKAISDLGKLASGIDKVNLSVGQSAGMLGRTQRTLDRYAKVALESSRSVLSLKTAQQELSKQFTIANRTIANQKSALEKAKAGTLNAKAVMVQYRKELATATKEVNRQAQQIDRLKNSLNGYTSAAGRASRTSILPKGQLADLNKLTSKYSALMGAPGVSSRAPGSSAFTRGISQQTNALGALLGRVTTNSAALSGFAVHSKVADKAIKQQATDTDVLSNSNVALRYALYSTATTFGLLAAAGYKAFGGLLQTGIDYQRNISNVLRTSQVESASTFANSPLVNGGIITAEQQTKVATQALTQAFLDLQSSIPVTSEDLTTIGTLASQMGIAASEVANFTEVSAKFSAATGISADESATGLARLGQLLPDVQGHYSELASAILKTGVNSIATEHQILQASTNIASISNVAHLSSAEVVALASAMSSLGITSELQRSTITTSFTKILSATNSGADAAKKYGDVLGISGQQFIDAWGDNAYNTFVRLTEAIANGKDSVGTLQDLNLASQRLTPTLLKIGQNPELFSASLKDANKGQKDNLELNRQFDIIAKTTASRLQVLSQTWDKFLVIVGGPAVQVIGDLAKGLSDLVEGLAKFVATPIGAFLGTLIVGVGLLGTGVFAVTAAVALAGASLLGLDYVIEQLGIRTGATTISMGAFAVGLDAATVKGLVLRGTMYTLAASLRAVLSPLSLIIAAFGVGIWAISSESDTTAAVRGINGYSNSLKQLEKELTNINGGERFNSKPLPAFLNGGAKPKKEQLPSFGDINNTGQNFGGKAVPDWIIKMNRGLGSWASLAGGSDSLWGDISLTDKELSKLAMKDGPAAEKQLENLQKAWVKSGQDSSTFASAFPDTITQLGLVSGKVGATTEDLKLYYTSLGDAANAEEVQNDLLQSQADALGLVTDGFTDGQAAHDKYVQAISSAGSSFFDIGSLLDTAYGKDKGQGGGLARLQKDLNSQVSAFKKWSEGIRVLTAEGAGALAQAFIEQGPSSQQAVTDALKLSPSARSELNRSMRDAAFFASQAYAETFASQNAILADVYKKTLQAGGDPLKALHDTERLLGKGDTLSASDVARLEKKYGITINVSLSGLDPKDVTDKIKDAQAAANAHKINVPISPFTGQGPLKPKTEFSVNENGHNIVLTVAPDTKKGQQVLDAWRANEYKTPVEFKALVDTSEATQKLLALKGLLSTITGNIHVSGSVGRAAFAKGGGVGIPGYAKGGSPHGYLRGPGTDTSDSMLVRASRGEYFNTAAAVRYYGADFFDALNRRAFPKFATGGQVGSSGPTGTGATMSVSVVQNYPTTVDPIHKLKLDTENLVAGLWP